MERIDLGTYYELPFIEAVQCIGEIFGDDAREKAADITASPYNAIVRLQIETDGIMARGTGFMIGQGMMLTAAHVMYDYDKKKMRTVWVVGEDGRLYEVYNAIIDPDYRKVPLPKYDWAVAKVSVLPGKTVPCLNILSVEDTQCPALKNHEAEVAGYPGIVRGLETIELYTEKGNIRDYSDADKKIRYTIDTSGGQSGSPIILYKDGTAYAVGIHNSGTKKYNIGRAIDRKILTAVRELSNL